MSNSAPAESVLLRAMFDALPDPVVGVCRLRHVLMANRVAAALRLEEPEAPPGLTEEQVSWRNRLHEAMDLVASHEGDMEELRTRINSEVTIMATAEDFVLLAIRRAPGLKAAQAELASTRTMMQRIFDATPALIFAKDAEGRYTLVNKGAQRLIGRPLDEILTMTYADAFPEAPQLEQMVAREREVIETGKGFTGVNSLVSEGKLRHFALQIVPLFGPGGQVEGMAGIGTDQTEKIQAERAALEREERFRLAFNHANGGIALLDLDGRFERVNPPLADLLEQDAEALVGQSILDYLHPSDHSALREFLADESDRLAGEVRLRTRDGREVVTETSAAVVRSVDDTPIQIVAHFTDVTVRRALEERARETEKLEVVEQLTSALAHDINNILGVIMGHVDLLRDFVTDDEAEEEFSSIITAAQRALALRF